MSLAYKISKFNRERKFKEFLSNLHPTSETTILDVGFSDKEFSSTDNFLEKHYNYPENITALGIEKPQNFSKKYPKTKVVTYNGKDFPFKNDVFDICWSNAVMEHVGDREAQVQFIKEIKRVAKTAFITTPNKYFPVEIHTRTPILHFLPKKIFDCYLTLIGKKWATKSYMNLLSKKNIHNILSLAQIHNYRIIKNRILFFTLDFVIIIE